ncbi:TIGR04086 family membrane protein [Laceyella sacchari]|nr:TIGR04086 family membrane protein [Laceyella sacchari]MRG26748.1 TIGR04086 family membrane protein [Laceyella tengchongensis]
MSDPDSDILDSPVITCTNLPKGGQRMKEALFDTAKKGWQSPWLVGQCWIWGIILFCSFLAALGLRYTSLPSDNVTAISYIVNAGALFAGGLASGRRAGRKGWMIGGIQGVLFVLLVWLLSFLAFDAAPTINPLAFLCFAFAVGGLGGMIGVNTKP